MLKGGVSDIPVWEISFILFAIVTGYFIWYIFMQIK